MCENHFKKEGNMSEVSSVYSSTDVIYRTGSKRGSIRGKNGDVKHIIFKDGEPIRTEIIKVERDNESAYEGSSKRKSKRFRTGTSRSRTRKSSGRVLMEKKLKLSERLQTAIRSSQTLWSEKEKIWISYQGNQNFLVKRFTPANILISQDIMTSDEILEGTIPGVLNTGWQKI